MGPSFINGNNHETSQRLITGPGPHNNAGKHTFKYKTVTHDGGGGYDDIYSASCMFTNIRARVENRHRQTTVCDILGRRMSELI